MRPEAQAWWELAGDDFEAAKATLESGHFHVTAFLAQQSVEKGLKALPIQRRKEMPPKTHNLQDLAEELGALASFETELMLLNPLYVATRCPDAANGVPSKNFNRELAGTIVADAEKVMAWCRSELRLS